MIHSLAVMSFWAALVAAACLLTGCDYASITTKAGDTERTCTAWGVAPEARQFAAECAGR